MKQIVMAIPLLILYGESARSQDSTFRRWVVGIGFEPAYTNRTLNYNASNKWVQELRNKEETPAFGFTTGVNARYWINSIWSIASGLLFANKAFVSKEKELTWTIPNEKFPGKSKTRFAYQYIEIPFKVNHHWQVGKFNFYASTGVSLDNFTNKRTSLLASREDNKKTKEVDNTNYGYRKNAYSVILGLGFDGVVSKRMLSNIKANHKHNFTSIVEIVMLASIYILLVLTQPYFYALNEKNNEPNSRNHHYEDKAWGSQ